MTLSRVASCILTFRIMTHSMAVLKLYDFICLGISLTVLSLNYRYHSIQHNYTQQSGILLINFQNNGTQHIKIKALLISLSRVFTVLSLNCRRLNIQCSDTQQSGILHINFQNNDTQHIKIKASQISLSRVFTAYSLKCRR